MTSAPGEPAEAPSRPPDADEPAEPEPPAAPDPPDERNDGDGDPPTFAQFLQTRKWKWLRILATVGFGIPVYFLTYLTWSLLVTQPHWSVFSSHIPRYWVVATLATPTEVGVPIAAEVLATANYFLHLEYRFLPYCIIRSLLGAAVRVAAFWARSSVGLDAFDDVAHKLIISYIENAVFLLMLALVENVLRAKGTFIRKWAWKHLFRHIGTCIGIVLTWPLLLRWRPRRLAKIVSKSFRTRMSLPYNQGSMETDLIDLELIVFDELVAGAQAAEKKKA